MRCTTSPLVRITPSPYPNGCFSPGRWDTNQSLPLPRTTRRITKTKHQGVLKETNKEVAFPHTIERTFYNFYDSACCSWYVRHSHAWQHPTVTNNSMATRLPREQTQPMHGGPHIAGILQTVLKWVVALIEHLITHPSYFPTRFGVSSSAGALWHAQLLSPQKFKSKEYGIVDIYGMPARKELTHDMQYHVIDTASIWDLFHLHPFSPDDLRGELVVRERLVFWRLRIDIPMSAAR